MLGVSRDAGQRQSPPTDHQIRHAPFPHTSQSRQEMAANRAQRFQSSVASILTKRPAQVHFLGAPGRIRTSDTRFRKPMLYSLSNLGEGSTDVSRSGDVVFETGRRIIPVIVAIVRQSEMADVEPAGRLQCGACCNESAARLHRPLRRIHSWRYTLLPGVIPYRSPPTGHRPRHMCVKGRSLNCPRVAVERVSRAALPRRGRRRRGLRGRICRVWSRRVGDRADGKRPRSGRRHRASRWP